MQTILTIAKNFHKTSNRHWVVQQTNKEKLSINLSTFFAIFNSTSVKYKRVKILKKSFGDLCCWDKKKSLKILCKKHNRHSWSECVDKIQSEKLIAKLTFSSDLIKKCYIWRKKNSISTPKVEKSLSTWDNIEIC
jgi:hypothetical protein